MTIQFDVYDHDQHRLLKPYELRIDGSGAIWYNQSGKLGMFEDWRPVGPESIWIEVINVRVLNATIRKSNN